MASEKIDPIGDEYFNPLRLADRIAGTLFFVSAALSILALLVSKVSHPTAHDFVHIAFPISVVALFCTTLAIRLYFFPRAQFARYHDFLAHAYDKQLSHKKTAAYYNNAATTVPTRIAAQVLESSFFSKRILSQMAFDERLKIGGYVLLWLITILYRNTDLAVIGVAAQIVFSEQILSRWFRLEWFRNECEKIYDELFRFIKTRPS